MRGCGHFEPLRHYAEVHLCLSPGPRGSGLTFESRCPTDNLAANWQNLIRSQFLGREHRGVLTGAPPEDAGERAVLRGRVPVATSMAYPAELAAFTKGQGQISLWFDGYAPCHNRDEVMARTGYEPERDTENPADSVFCSHGAGHTVKWDEAADHMHVWPD